MADEQVKIGIVAEDKTGPGVGSAKRNLQGLGQTAQQTAGGLSNLKAVALGVGGAFAGMGLVAAASGLRNMAGAALQSYASYERLNQSINAMAAKEALLTGSATNMAQALAMTKTQSKETLQWISKLAIESPFKQNDVAQAFRLAQALGFNTQEAKRLTAATLDWATATGAQGYDIERVNRALGQMKTKGKVSMEELQQLTDAGLDAPRILAQAFGKSGLELEKAFRKGEITVSRVIEAILKDTEKLYGGAGKESANSMTGLLSTLEEIQDITGRNLLGGMFQAAQPYLAELTGILNSPEVQGGITAFGAGLGAGLTGMLDGAAASAEKVSDAIQPLLDAAAPTWMVALQAIAAATGSEFKITVTPQVMGVSIPEAGLNIDVSATATTITAATGEFLTIDTLAKSVTLAAGASLPTFEFKANITPEAQAVIDKLLGAGAEGGAKGFGYELGVQTRLELLREMSSLSDKLPKMDWEAYKQEWNKTFDTWQPAIKGLSEVGPRLSAAIQSAMSTPISIVGKWWDNGPGTMFAQMQAPFKEPIMLAGSWANNTVTALWNAIQSWFTANPVNLTVNTTYDRNPELTPRGVAPGTKYPIDITPPAPNTYVDPVTGEVKSRAIGDGFHRGGMAWVGEQGPEAVWLPRGTEIFTNRDSRSMFGLPHYAEGTDGAKQFGSAVWGFLRIFGIQRQGEMTGPPTREQWNKTFHDIAGAGIDAAKRTGDAFVNAAGDTAKAFASTLESALGNVPGLFGTSDVTDRQMKLAAAGVPQNFADDYIRQLSDEVLNGKDWAGVDIKDAAKRAGIDPNLPNEIVLDLVKEAWNNGSFFANEANLDLINTDAVKSSLEQQQKEAQGKANIMSMFGLTDESSQATADQLGAALNTVFGQAAESDAMAGSGTVIFNKLITGLSDPSTAAAGISSMAASLTAATGTPENSQAIYDGGVATGITWLKGFDYAMQNASMSPPSVAGPAVGPPTNPNPPGRAVGVGFWAGGYMQVHANETIYAPRGTRVDRPGEGMGMAAATIVNYVTINQQIDEEAFLAKMARRLRAGR